MSDIRLNYAESLVLRYCMDHEGCVPEDIGRTLDMPDAAVETALARLMELGFIHPNEKGSIQ